MNIDKIKQVISLQREIKEENNRGVINISMSDEKVLVHDELFKKVFENNEYNVRLYNETYYYNGEFEGIKFTANNDKSIF